MSCGGCGAMMAHPDIHAGGGSVSVINRDPSVDTLLAHLIESTMTGKPVSVSEVDYERLPTWAKRLFDAVRGDKTLTCLVVACIAWCINRGFDITQILVEGKVEHANEMKAIDKQAEVDREKQRRQFEHEEKMLELQKAPGPRQSDNDEARLAPFDTRSDPVAPAMQEYLAGLRGSSVPAGWKVLLKKLTESMASVERIRAGVSFSSRELEDFVREHNDLLGELYRAIRARKSFGGTLWVMPPLCEPKVHLISAGYTGGLHSAIVGTDRHMKAAMQAARKDAVLE